METRRIATQNIARDCKLRVFCKKHKKQHYHKHKTRVIVDKNNRKNRKIERERKSQQPSD